MYMNSSYKYFNGKLTASTIHDRLTELMQLDILKLPRIFLHQGNTDSGEGHKDEGNKSMLGTYHHHHGLPAHLHNNGVCPYEDSRYQVEEITNDSITIKTKNIKNKYIIVRELDSDFAIDVRIGKRILTASDGNTIITTDFNQDGTFIIKHLKSFTSYNIVIGELGNPNLRAVLNYPIRTDQDFDNVISQHDYNRTYKAQFDRIRTNQIPPSWSEGRDTRATVTGLSLPRTVSIRGNLVDNAPLNGVVDGINDSLEYNEPERFNLRVRKFYFPRLGITVFECPFRPGYFNVAENLAMLGKTQSFIELGNKTIYSTLSQLDYLDYQNRFNIWGNDAWDTFRILLSVGADAVTVASLGNALPLVTGIKTFFTKFLTNLSPYNPKDPLTLPLGNFLVSNISDLVKGDLDISNLGFSNWGEWFIATVIPFVGTYGLLEDFYEAKPFITEAHNSMPSTNYIVGVQGSIDGIFFNSN